MLAWLGSLIGFLGGGLRQAWDGLINVIRNVDSYLEARINYLNTLIYDVYAQLVALSYHVSNFILSTYSPFAQWVFAQFNGVYRWANGQIFSLNTRITVIDNDLSSQIDGLSGRIASTFLSLVKWILSTIFGPLSSELAQALGWIGKEGAFLIDLILHPDKLIKILWAFIFAGLAGFVAKFAPLIVSYGLRSWKAWAGILIKVGEDILTHVLLGGSHGNAVRIPR